MEVARTAEVPSMRALRVLKSGKTYIGIGQEAHPDGSGQLRAHQLPSAGGQTRAHPAPLASADEPGSCKTNVPERPYRTARTQMSPRTAAPPLSSGDRSLKAASAAVAAVSITISVAASAS